MPVCWWEWRSRTRGSMSCPNSKKLLTQADEEKSEIKPGLVLTLNGVLHNPQSGSWRAHKHLSRGMLIMVYCDINKPARKSDRKVRRDATQCIRYTCTHIPTCILILTMIRTLPPSLVFPLHSFTGYFCIYVQSNLIYKSFKGSVWI